MCTAFCVGSEGDSSTPKACKRTLLVYCFMLCTNKVLLPFLLIIFMHIGNGPLKRLDFVNNISLFHSHCPLFKSVTNWNLAHVVKSQFE